MPRTVRTEAAISLTLAWDPTKPIDAADVPALQSFLLAFRGLVRVPGLAARGDVSLLEAALVGLPKPAHLPASIPAAEEGLTVKETVEKQLYAATLAAHRGNVQRSAVTLGVTPRTVHNKAVRYHLPTGATYRRLVVARDSVPA